jgi:hypothetical protein
MNGTAMLKELTGTEMKVQAMNGNVSKHETIEASIKIARLMI